MRCLALPPYAQRSFLQIFRLRHVVQHWPDARHFKNIPNRPLLAGVAVSAVHTWASQVIVATGAFGSFEAETTA